MSLQENVYTPDQTSSWGLSVWRVMLSELIASRELIWRLFVRDFSARYKQVVLGFLWMVIIPIAGVATFAFMNSAGVLNVGDTSVPYTVFALLGLTIWQMLAGGLVATANSLIGAERLIVKINFPKKSLVIAAMGQVIFEFVVRLILLAITMVIFATAPKWTIIFLPLTLLPLFLLTLGLGFFLALLNVLMRDIGNMVPLITSFLMFLTPVLYPAPESGTLATVMAVNPLSGLVTAARDVVFTGYLTDPLGFAWSSTLGIVFFFFAWRVFHLVESRIAERV